MPKCFAIFVLQTVSVEPAADGKGVVLALKKRQGMYTYFKEFNFFG